MRAFKATIRTLQDIVSNLPNGFQLVGIEGEGHLPTELPTMVDQMVQAARVKLKTLGELETVNEKEMPSARVSIIPAQSLGPRIPMFSARLYWRQVPSLAVSLQFVISVREMPSVPSSGKNGQGPTATPAFLASSAF